MTGVAEMARLRKQLDATFDRVKQLSTSPDLELQADFARYLCVLVSGYLENSLIEVVLEHARVSGGATLQRFVERRTRRFANSTSERILDLLGSFDAGWRQALETFFKNDVDNVKEAINSVVGLRNRIAHGAAVSVTFHRVREYYTRVQIAIDQIVAICGIT